MQRDVEFEVESTDKSGGFIGALWLKNENAAVSLAREGYAFVHAFSADGLSWAKQIYDAEVCTVIFSLACANAYMLGRSQASTT